MLRDPVSQLFVWEDPSHYLYLAALLSVMPGNMQGIEYSFSPIALIFDTVFLIRGRFSTSPRLCWLTNWGHYVVGGNGASHRHGLAVVFLHWALHSSGAPLTSLSMAVFTQCLGLLTHPGFLFILLACLTRWLDSALGSLLPVSGLELTNDADCLEGFG